MIEEIKKRLNQKLEEKVRKCDLLIPFRIVDMQVQSEWSPGFALNPISEFLYQIKFVDRPILKIDYRYGLQELVCELQDFFLTSSFAAFFPVRLRDRIFLENLFTMLQINWMIRSYNNLQKILTNSKFVALDWCVNLLKFLGFEKEMVFKLVERVLEAGKLEKVIGMKSLVLEYAFLVLGDCLFFDEMFNDEAFLPNLEYKCKLENVVEEFKLGNAVDVSKLSMFTDIVSVVDAFVDSMMDQNFFYEDKIGTFEDRLLKAFNIIGGGHYLTEHFLSLIKEIIKLGKIAMLEVKIDTERFEFLTEGGTE